MKKQIISIITLIVLAFMLGFTSKVLATNQTMLNEDIPITIERTNIPTSEPTQIQNDTQWVGINSTPTTYVNNINNQLQNMATKQPKDMRKQVVVMVIIIITVLLIVGLVTWYYMTNQ